MQFTLDFSKTRAYYSYRNTSYKWLFKTATLWIFKAIQSFIFILIQHSLLQGFYFSPLDHLQTLSIIDNQNNMFIQVWRTWGIIIVICSGFLRRQFDEKKTVTSKKRPFEKQTFLIQWSMFEGEGFLGFYFIGRVVEAFMLPYNISKITASNAYQGLKYLRLRRVVTLVGCFMENVCN